MVHGHRWGWLVLAGIGVTTLVFLVWSSLRGGARTQSVSTHLSDRAREFIAQDAGDGSGLWAEARLEDARLPQAGEEVRTDCFLVRLPMPVVRLVIERTDERCVIRSLALQPRSNLVIAAYASEQPESDPGITMRVRDPERYSQRALPVAAFARVWVFADEASVTIFAWQDQHMITVAFTDLHDPMAVNDELITTLLAGFTLLPRQQDGTMVP